MTPSARPSTHLLPPLQPVARIGHRSSLSRGHFWTIAIGYAFVFIALGISLYQNLKQAKERQYYIEAAYVTGFERGGNFVKDAIERAFAARELAEEKFEARQHANEEASPSPEAEPPL